MAIQGECPKCGKRVLHVNVETVVSMVDGESKGRCISYSCIHCNVVLGVQVDHRAKPRARSTKPPAKA
jgi:DNA-directed RNA polymerase subunit RPC12/RpoP